MVVKEQQLHPVRGSLQHIDLQQVKLDEAIEAEVAIELEGAETAPGVKDGGVLEHVTREITVEALPTEIPDRIVADVSAMEINDTLQLAAVAAPSGVTFVADDPDEVTIVTLSPPRVEEEPEPEVEEETELVGEDGEAGEATPARAATRATPAGSSPCRCSAAPATAASRATASSSSGSATPGPSTPQPPQRRLRGRRGAGAALGPGAAAPKFMFFFFFVGFEVLQAELLSQRHAGELPRARRTSSAACIAEGRTGPGGPRVAVLQPQTFMNASGDSAGPARGSLKVPLDRVVVVHDEIDLPFGEIQPRLGGGLAGHNGLKSLNGASATPSSGACGSGSGGPTRPTPRSSPPTCSAVPRAPGRGRGAGRRRRRRDRAPGRAARFRGDELRTATATA